MSGWELLKAHLQQPEYLHVLLNPLPVYGLATGFLAMLLALAVGSRQAQVVALALVFVCAISAWPVAELGESAYDRVKAQSDHDGDLWLDEHMDRVDDLLWVFYVVAGLAAASVIIPLRWPGSTKTLYLITAAGTLGALACGGWIGYAGGQVRHKEFRYSSPPPAKPHEHEEHHHHE